MTFYRLGPDKEVVGIPFDGHSGERGMLAVAEACKIESRIVERSEWRYLTGIAFLSTVLLPGPHWDWASGNPGPAFETMAFVWSRDQTYWAKAQASYPTYLEASEGHARILNIVEVDEEYPYRPQALADHLGAAIRLVGE